MQFQKGRRFVAPSALVPRATGPLHSRLFCFGVGQPIKQNRQAAAIGVALLFALSWISVYQTGGRQAELTDLGFVAVICAGLYFGAPGGVLAGVVAMVVISPLGPIRPALQPSGWVTHGLLAIGIGALVGVRSYLFDRNHAIVEELADRLVSTYQRTLHLIAETTELRDPITAGHSRRVARNAKALGVAVGLDADQLDDLYWAGLLHDIGKIAIPETILQKEGPLDAEEWALMREHPLIGERLIMESSPDLAAIAVAVAAHHESWDGSGYPNGRAGTEIPLSGRILAIADVFDALTSTRPYRKPLHHADALTYLASKSGSAFDPALVVHFQRLLTEDAIVVAPSAPQPLDAARVLIGQD
jgi:hypothetical protein